MTLAKIQSRKDVHGLGVIQVILVEQGHQTRLVLGDAEIHQLEDSHHSSYVWII